MRVFVVALIVFSTFFVQRASAQRTIGIGFQAGLPTGLNLQFRNSGGMSPDILFAYDLDRFLFLNVHGLWYGNLENSGRFRYFYGPGAFIGLYDTVLKNDDRLGLGFSGDFGLSLRLGRVDLFMQATPRLSILPGTEFALGGGAGLRFWL